MQAIDLSLIVRDPEIQPRDAMNQDVIVQMAEDMVAGIAFPPVVVFFDGDRNYLSDGFHRTAAAEAADLGEIEADIRQGSREDALWFACGSNKEHDAAGQRRTNADKRRAVEMALRARPDNSDREIAKHCGIGSHHTVEKIRQALVSSGQFAQMGNERAATREVNGHVQTYTINVSNIGRSAPDAASPAPVAPAKPTFACGTCGDAFDSEVWHCPGCDHHWLPGVEECPNCHGSGRMPDGSIVDLREARAVAPEGRQSTPGLLVVEAPAFVLSGTPEPPRPASRPTFNQTNEMVEWAWWTWNPVTGCEHNCVYCYARDIANRFYPEKFTPTFRPERLDAPRYTKQPEMAATEVGWKNVFVCSMADLFGRWVPQQWIDDVFASCRKSPEWNYLFLTKFPNRYETLDFPETSWVGTSVDEQKRVANAEKAFAKIKAPVKWLSCEPLREPLKFKRLDLFDWVVIGGQSRSSQAPEFLPPFAWVANLVADALKAGCKVYIKPNIGFDGPTRPRDYPGMEVPESK